MVYALRIPPRFPGVSPEQIDLSTYYNASLFEGWHGGDTNNNLSILPPGLLCFDDRFFDVRGLIQLSGIPLLAQGKKYPELVHGIKIGQRCRRLNFLQGSAWKANDGRLLGRYLVHYADGQQKDIPIIYGMDVRDWNAGNDRTESVKKASVVWKGTNPANFPVRLFLSTWNNPLPGIEIGTIDFVSTVADSAPFLVAITAEP